MSPVIEIRHARPDEAQALSRIARLSKSHWGYPAAWLDAWSEELTIDEDLVQEQRVRTCLLDGIPVGFYALEQREDVVELCHFWILPKAIGRGLGRLLFEDAVQDALAHGATRLIVVSDPYAEGFYRKMGGIRVNVQKNQYANFVRFLPVLAFELPATRHAHASSRSRGFSP